MKRRGSKSLRVLARYKEKIKTRPVSPVLKSGRSSFRTTDFTFKVEIKRKEKKRWVTLTPQVEEISSRRIRIRRGENKGRLRRLPARRRLSSRVSLPSRHLGRLRIFYKGKKVAETRIRKNLKTLTPKRLRRSLQGGSQRAPKIRGQEAQPVRNLYQIWDPLLGQLPQAAWWIQDPGIFFNLPTDLRQKRSKWRVWFVVELPPDTVSPSSFKMYGQKDPNDGEDEGDEDAPEDGEQSVFYLTFFVIEIDRMGALEAAETIKGGPLFSRRAEEHLDKHNENDADHPWLSVRAFVGIEGLG